MYGLLDSSVAALFLAQGIKILPISSTLCKDRFGARPFVSRRGRSVVPCSWSTAHVVLWAIDRFLLSPAVSLK